MNAAGFSAAKTPANPASSNASVCALICAGGKGTRAGFNKNKLLKDVLGIPVLERTMAAFAAAGADEIVVAASPDDFSEIAPLCRKYGATLCEGGATRFFSVHNALAHVRSEIVLIHDGARPFVSAEAIAACVENVKKYGSGVCAVPSTDTLATADENGEILSYPVRANTYRIQTPQGFYLTEIRAAYEKAIAENATDFTDDSSVYAAYVRKPKLCAGEEKNVKLTYAEDFRNAFARVGIGVDTHAFGHAQNYIVLGGVRVPSESGLVAHSDGDVLCHAVMDALLSAAGLKDIGHYFPDTNDEWKNADSMKMLAQVTALIREQGFRPANLSAAIQAEKPRLAGYIEAIKKSLAEALNLPETAVGISAGTNEKLGYIGEGKGITVNAAVLLEKI